MCVNAHVPRRSAQTLSFPVGDVLFRLGVAVLLGHAEIDDMDDISALRAGATDKEIIRLDVAIDKVLFVDRLHSRQLEHGIRHDFKTSKYTDVPSA